MFFLTRCLGAPSTGTKRNSGCLHHNRFRNKDQEGKDVSRQKTVLRIDPTYANAKLQVTMTITRDRETNNGRGAPRPSAKYPAAAYIL
jgi:hypothetical protein